MTIWQNIRLCIVAEHCIIVVEHLFLFFITQHSYLYVGRTLFLFFMKNTWILLENILARVRHPLGFPLEYAKTGVDCSKSNTIGSDSSGVKHDRFIDETNPIVLDLEEFTPVLAYSRWMPSCSYKKKRMCSIVFPVSDGRTNQCDIFIFYYSTWYGVLLYFTILNVSWLA